LIQTAERSFDDHPLCPALRAAAFQKLLFGLGW
jgi:hypothetical protein